MHFLKIQILSSGSSLGKRRWLVFASVHLEDEGLLPLEDVEGAAEDLSGLEPVQEVVGVDDLAPGGVDEDDVLLHLGDGVLVNEVVGLFEQRYVDGDDGAVLQEVVQLDVLGVGDGGDPVLGRVRVEAQDLLAQAGDLLDRLLSDQARADNAHLKFDIFHACRLENARKDPSNAHFLEFDNKKVAKIDACHLKSIFFALIRTHGLVLDEDALESADGEVGVLGLLVALLQVLGQGQHGGDGVLGDGGGRVGGDAADADAGLAAQVHRDVVEPGGAAQDQLEPGTFFFLLGALAVQRAKTRRPTTLLCT